MFHAKSAILDKISFVEIAHITWRNHFFISLRIPFLRKCRTTCGVVQKVNPSRNGIKHLYMTYATANVPPVAKVSEYLANISTLANVVASLIGSIQSRTTT